MTIPGSVRRYKCASLTRSAVILASNGGQNLPLGPYRNWFQFLVGRSNLKAGFIPKMNLQYARLDDHSSVKMGLYCETWYIIKFLTIYYVGDCGFLTQLSSLYSQALTRFIRDSRLFKLDNCGTSNGGQEHNSLVILWRDSCTSQLRNGES